jgi:hypothetical protein
MTTTLPASAPTLEPTTASASAPVAASTTPVLALVGFISALAGIALGAVIPLSIVAIVLGAMALSREPQGRTLAIWSIVLGAIPGALIVIGGVLATAFIVPFGLWAAFIGG